MRESTLFSLKNALPAEIFNFYMQLKSSDKDFIDKLEEKEMLSPAQLMRVVEGMYNGLGRDKIQFIARREFSELQMSEAIFAFKNGCSIKELSSFYMPDRFASDMHKCIMEINKRAGR